MPAIVASRQSKLWPPPSENLTNTALHQCCCYRYNNQEIISDNIVFQSKADDPRTGHTDTFSSSCDLDLDPMTLIYEPDLNILQTKNKLSRSRLKGCRKLKHYVQSQTDRQTDRHRYRCNRKHSRMIDLSLSVSITNWWGCCDVATWWWGVALTSYSPSHGRCNWLPWLPWQRGQRTWPIAV